MMHYGRATSGHTSERGLVGWLVVRNKTDVKQQPVAAAADNNNTIKLRLLGTMCGVDGRSKFGLGVMRAMIDGAAASAISKYERIKNEVHEAIEYQNIQADVLEEMKIAVAATGSQGQDFINSHWDRVLEKMNGARLLNPPLTANNGGWMHAGGMHWHLTSSSKRRKLGDDDDEEGDRFAHMRAPETARANGRLHTHSDAVCSAMYQKAVCAIAACVIGTDDKSNSLVLSEAGSADVWLKVDDATTNEDGRVWNIGKHHEPLACTKSGDGGTWTVKSAENPTIVSSAPQLLATLKLDDKYSMPSCMHKLVLPAMASAMALEAVRTSSVNRVGDMLAHVSPFVGVSEDTTNFIAAVEAVLGKNPKDASSPRRFFRLTPSDSKDHDMIVDFDHKFGWGIGFTPCPTTDAVEGAQAYLHHLKLKTLKKTASRTATPPRATSPP